MSATDLSAAEQAARDQVAARPDVSRETLVALDRFRELVRHWTQTINLVAPGDVDRLWERHIADSVALADFLPEAGRWCDWGAGGGFPIIPLAIMARDRSPAVKFSAVESDRRKAVFLTRAAHDLGLTLTVRTARIETVAEEESETVSARALASIDELLDLADRRVQKPSRVILLKGEGVAAELTAAARRWHMRYQLRRNAMTSRGYILLVQGYRRDSTAGPGAARAGARKGARRGAHLRNREPKRRGW